jgi:hypothetical protein
MVNGGYTFSFRYFQIYDHSVFAKYRGLKGIFGGPLTLQEVRSLGPIQNAGENKQRDDVER